MMKSEKARVVLALGLGLAITLAPGLSVAANNPSLGKVVPRGAAELNQTRLQAEATVYAGDAVTTPEAGLALILLPQGGQIHVGPASAVVVGPGDAGVVAELNRGALVARSRPGQNVSVWAANLLVSPQSPETLYQVALTDSGAIVAAESGTVSVAGSNRTVTVPSGEAMRFEVAPGTQAPRGVAAGAGMTTAKAVVIAVAISLGAAIPVAWLIADNLADDARQEGCQEAITSISAALSTAGCT